VFGLVPGFDGGDAAMVVAILGLLFITGALLRVFLESSKGDHTDDAP
jgi:hypothetical protein